MCPGTRFPADQHAGPVLGFAARVSARVECWITRVRDYPYLCRVMVWRPTAVLQQHWATPQKHGTPGQSKKACLTQKNKDMSTKGSRIETNLKRLAKQMALTALNSDRVEARKPLLRHVPAHWWQKHGPHVLSKARGMKIVTIISLWSKLRWHAPAVRYDVLAQGSDVDATLENTFSVTNRPGRPMGRQACSTSAGDLMVLDGRHYLVEPQGFHELTDAEAQAIEELSPVDTWWGYDRLVKKHLI